jgi:hypothetical protein
MLETLLKDKYLKIKTNNETYLGLFVGFSKHIDGGIILKHVYSLNKQEYKGNCVLAKMCTPSLEQNNYKTTVILNENDIELRHVNIRTKEVLIDVITILS